MPLALAQLQDIGDRITDRLRPWSRSAEFWVRAADIYTSYKVAPPDPVPLLHWLVRQARARAREVFDDMALRF